MKKIKILFLAFFVFSAIGFAQDRMTPELLWSFGRVGAPAVSPDGKQMVYSVKYYNLGENKGNADLYILDLTKPGAEPQQLTKFSGSEYNAVWRPDGNRIGFLSAESGDPQLWEINPDGTGIKQVSHIAGGIGNFNYSPRFQYISYTQDVKMDKTVNELYSDLPKANARIIDDLMYRHWKSWHDFSYSHVHYAKYKDGSLGRGSVDIMENEAYDSPLNPFGGGEQIAWSPDDNYIAYTCKKKSGADYTVSTNSDIYLYDLRNKETTNLTKGMMGYDTEPVFAPNSAKVAWLSMERDGFESDRNRIFVFDFTTKTKKELTAGWDYTAGSITWSPDGSRIYFLSPIDATYQMFVVGANGGTPKQVTNGIHNYGSVTATNDRLIGIKKSMSMPSEIFSVDIKTGAETQLTFVNKPILDKMEMGKVEKRMIKTTDDKDMLVWVIYPPGFDPNKKYPTLLYCQGGPQSAVSQFFSYRWNFQLMAANDYIIVAPNRRGLPSFGRKWNDDISGDWGGQCMADYLSAIDAVAKEPYVDENNLGAIGASFGGYSVYYLAGKHEKRFKAFISHCGLFNLESWYGATEEMFFANFDLKGAYWDQPQPKSYENFSPHKFVGNWDTPMLVIHGEKDFRVPIGEGIQAFNAAQLQGIPSRFLYFPTEGHWVQSPQNGVLWHRVFFDWLDKWLKK